MQLKKLLSDLMRVVIEEAERNPEFGQKVEEALGLQPKEQKPPSGRPANRRAPAVLDPIELARQGETVLREELVKLQLTQLKDIVAEYGMDPGKLVLKWKLPGRVVDRIVEISLARARKGDGFLSSGLPRSD